MLGGATLAGVLSAGVATGQLFLLRWSRVFVPDQTYEAGNDTWPYQMVLAVWCTASAVVVAAVVARPFLRDTPWRYVAVATAALGSVAPQRLAAGWAAGAVSATQDPAAAAVAAMLVGALVGALFGAAVLTWRGAARGAAVWVGWVWLNVAVTVATHKPLSPYGDQVVSTSPLGTYTPFWPGHQNQVLLLALLSPLLPAAFLGWWARRRGDGAPLFGAVLGPVLLVAVHLPVAWLPGCQASGDHYSLAGDLIVWLLAAVLGLGVGALGVLVARVRPSRPRSAG